MASTYPRSTVAIGGHPIYAMLMPFPYACFTLALLTDFIYWQTSYLMWAEFSAWLLLAGITFGGLAAVFGTIDLLVSREVRTQQWVWPHALGNLIVLLLAFVNNFVHARDGWTSVVPLGITLSALTVIAMLVTAWLGASLVHVHARTAGDRDYA